jgi:hypothetical protein
MNIKFSNLAKELPLSPSTALAFSAFLERLACKKETLGLALLGSLGDKGLHPFDSFSDLDLAVFFENEDQPKWAPEFSFPLYLGDENMGPYLNVFQNRMALITPSETRIVNISKYEALSSAHIIYDNNGQVANGIEELIDGLQPHLFLANLLHRSDRFLRRNPEKLVQRKAIFSAHLLVNEALNFMIQAVFFLNNLIPPHTKWIEHDLHHLSWTPSNFFERIKLIATIKSLSEEHLKKRIQVAIPLLDELFTQARKQGMLTDDYYQLICTEFHNDRQILPIPFADRVIKDLQTVKMKIDYSVIRSLINTSLCSNYAELVKILDEIQRPNFDNLLSFAQVKLEELKGSKQYD